MIELKPALFDKLEAGPSKDDHTSGLKIALQAAIELEHATIPPYLYALYSLRPGKNEEIRKLLYSVVTEEMLHMTLACNILNAIGGSPVLDDPKFIPRYPGPLPGAVESGLIVPLSRFSRDLVNKVFMVIEEPERPLSFLTSEQQPKRTIGKFYKEIKNQIVNLGKRIFTGDSRKQVTSLFWSKNELFEITDPASAARAIEIIVEQGEGTSTSPLDLEQTYAHYYRFAEIYHGKKLIPDPQSKEGYRYGGDPIPFDESGVIPLISNPKASNYLPYSQAWCANNTFNYTYTILLKTLHVAFNKNPKELESAIGLMESLKEQAMHLMNIPVGNGNAGPSFEYQPINP